MSALGLLHRVCHRCGQSEKIKYDESKPFKSIVEMFKRDILLHEQYCKEMNATENRQ